MISTSEQPATQAGTTGTSDRPAASLDVEIVLPVHNEERDLVPSVRRLHAYLCQRFPFRYRITIADNASSDRTWQLASELSAHLPRRLSARSLRRTANHRKSHSRESRATSGGRAHA